MTEQQYQRLHEAAAILAMATISVGAAGDRIVALNHDHVVGNEALGLVTDSLDVLGDLITAIAAALKAELQVEASAIAPASNPADTNELRRLRDDVDEICIMLDPKAVPGAINWGDLGAAWVARSYDEDNRTALHVRIEEASPGTDTLIVAVRDGLAARGWDVNMIDVQTEW